MTKTKERKTRNRTVYSQASILPRRRAKMNDRSKTEMRGYIPDHVRIKAMIMSGEALEDFRKAQYDFGGTDIVPEGFLDPTRNSNFDLADATFLAREQDRKYKEAKKRAEQSREAQEEAQAEGLNAGENDKADIPDGGK